MYIYSNIEYINYYIVIHLVYKCGTNLAIIHQILEKIKLRV